MFILLFVKTGRCGVSVDVTVMHAFNTTEILSTAGLKHKDEVAKNERHPLSEVALKGIYANIGAKLTKVY